MPKYICFQRSVSVDPSADVSDGPAKFDFEAAFDAWTTTHGDALIDMGGQFGRSVLAHAAGTSETTDGGVKGLSGGYMILAAEDLDHAVAIARAFPGLVRPGSAVELVEIRGPG